MYLPIDIKRVIMRNLNQPPSDEVAQDIISKM